MVFETKLGDGVGKNRFIDIVPNEIITRVEALPRRACVVLHPFISIIISQDNTGGTTARRIHDDLKINLIEGKVDGKLFLLLSYYWSPGLDCVSSNSHILQRTGSTAA